jgi:5-methyltetrahydrofolate--homocysteine methyltransferase
MDEVNILPKVVRVVMDLVDVPLCLDSSNPKALELALKVYQGKPIINSVTGQERSLKEVLPLVKEYNAVVIGLTMNDEGIPNDVDQRVAIAFKIVERAEALGIPREDIIIDCLTLTVGADSKAGFVTIEAVRKVKAELGVNMTLGVSNISYGLPDRNQINCAFLAIAISAGVNCPIIDAAKVRPIVLTADVVMGHDRYARRYIEAYRQRHKR